MALEKHLAGCDTCRTRLLVIEGVGAELSRACRDELGPPAPMPDEARARLRTNVAELSVELDRSWRFRLVEALATVPRSALVGAAVIAIVLVANVWRPRHAALKPDERVASVESGARPVRSLTPGATRRASVAELCAGRVAPPPIPASVRRAVLRDYGMEDVPERDYELDYLITPELGGAADQRNLWPERYGSRVWNAGVKDELERLLPQLVCRGELDLATAQQDIAVDWIAAYRKYFRTDRPAGRSHASGSLADDDVDPAVPAFVIARATVR